MNNLIKKILIASAKYTYKFPDCHMVSVNDSRGNYNISFYCKASGSVTQFPAFGYIRIEDNKINFSENFNSNFRKYLKEKLKVI